jgi:hypothetical protein
MNSHLSPGENSAVTLPLLSSGVIRRYRRWSPTFDAMLRRLHRNDPAAARWLYSAADAIAPADVIEKERYATLALGLYYMLHEQLFVDEFEELLRLPSVNLRESNGPAKSLPGDNAAASI